jgi:hypothetical protein
VALLTPDQNPTITDTILFSIPCPDATGCFVSNKPYMVNNVTIYYISRDTANGSSQQYTLANIDPNIQAQIAIAQAAACAAVTPDALSAALATIAQLQDQLQATAISQQLYYSESSAVAVFGSPDYPAWLSSDTNNPQPLTQILVDENNNPVYGQFQLEWTPLGMREGDYFICWTWTPNPSGSTLCSSRYFFLNSSPMAIVTIPPHLTAPNKYQTLLERYLPEMFKLGISNRDLTPEVLQQFDYAIADGFTFVEDIANQTLDIIDANATPESLLQILGDNLGVKLRSDDPTLWRRQIKEAVPLFKKKGTLAGLVQALAQAGITLSKFTRMWQVVSKYTYQEAFTVTQAQVTAAATSHNYTFPLTKIGLSPTSANFEIYTLPLNSTTWTVVYPDPMNPGTPESIQAANIINSGLTFSWGTTGNVPTLVAGEIVRVVYQVTAVPSSPEQTNETYLRALPLADQRNPRAQVAPLMNWNVRLIADDDPMLNTLIPEKTPFAESTIFGKIRTEFPYSENIYNMDEYNGSKRDSTSPCDIDPNFIDPCSQGLSSSYTVDLQIDHLSDDRLSEARNIIREFTPFHAHLFSINLFGGIQDFVPPPVETIEFLVHLYQEDSSISGQYAFRRGMDPTYTIDSGGGYTAGPYPFNRSNLANPTAVNGGGNSGTITNKNIILFAPNASISDVGASTNPSLTYLEVLSPSPSAGTYTISGIAQHQANVSGVTEPIHAGAFTYNLSNEVFRVNSSASITQDNLYSLFDSNVEFAAIPGIAVGWTVTSSWGTCTISKILPNNSLVLTNNGSLPSSNSTGITYSIKNLSSVTIQTSTTGSLNVYKRGLVNLGTGAILWDGNSFSFSAINIQPIVTPNFFVKYGGTQYPVIETISHTTLYIDGYSGGNVSGVSLVLYNRLITNSTGYFQYFGTTLTTSTNWEMTLGIANGDNPPAPNTIVDDNIFKEDYLILIDGDYYSINEINGTTITLGGRLMNWTLAGTSVNYVIYWFQKVSITVPPGIWQPNLGGDFNRINRSSENQMTYEIISHMIEMPALAFKASKPGSVEQIVSQGENITFTIEHREEEK